MVPEELIPERGEETETFIEVSTQQKGGSWVFASHCGPWTLASEVFGDVTDTSSPAAPFFGEQLQMFLPSERWKGRKRRSRRRAGGEGKEKGKKK